MALVPHYINIDQYSEDLKITILSQSHAKFLYQI